MCNPVVMAREFPKMAGRQSVKVFQMPAIVTKLKCKQSIYYLK